MSSIWLSNAFSSVPYWLFLQGLLSEKPKKRRLYCNLGDQDRFFCSGSASSLYQRILKMGCGDPLHTVKIGLCVFGNVRLGLHPWWQGLHFHKVFHKIFLKFQVFGLQKLMVFHWSGPFPYAGKNSWESFGCPKANVHVLFPARSAWLLCDTRPHRRCLQVWLSVPGHPFLDVNVSVPVALLNCSEVIHPKALCEGALVFPWILNMRTRSANTADKTYKQLLKTLTLFRESHTIYIWKTEVFYFHMHLIP